MKAWVFVDSEETEHLAQLIERLYRGPSAPEERAYIYGRVEGLLRHLTRMATIQEK